MYGNFKYQQLKNVGISQEKALQMAAFVKVSSFEEGQVIWSKGSKIDSWRFIINGLVAASTESPRGLLMPISIYGEGSWFGEQSIINRKTSYADFVCLAPTDVLLQPLGVHGDHGLQEARALGRFQNGAVSWVHHAQHQVVAQRPSKEAPVLLGIAYSFGQERLGDVGELHVIQQDAPALRLVHAAEQT